MEELASAKRSHNAHKGIFGQRVKTFESRIASFKRSPEVPQDWAEVEDAFDKVKLSYDRLQNAYTEVIIMEHDPDLETQNKTSSTNEVIKLIQGWFRTFGYAKRARHDDGPEFRDRFVAWLKQVGCKSEVSSAYNPASNGLAEAGVKNVKALLKKCMDRKECFETALAEFRIAPREDGYSPAELFYRRQVRGLLPELPKKLNVEEAEKARDRVQEAYTAQRQTRSASKPLVLGQRVWLQEQDSKKWSIGGVVKSIRDSGRSYVVETDGGAAYLRNRRYIKASTATARRNVVGASTAVVDKGKKRGGVRFKLKVQFEDVDSQK